jgi:chromosome segregation ATPase
MSIPVELDLKDILLKIEGKIDKLDDKLENQIQQLDNKLENQIQQLDRKFDNKIDQLDSKIDKLDHKFEQKFDTLQKDVIDLKIGQTKIEGKIETLDARIKNVETITGKVPDITEKIGEQKTWRTIIATAITALISGVVGWFLRGFRP